MGGGGRKSEKDGKQADYGKAWQAPLHEVTPGCRAARPTRKWFKEPRSKQAASSQQWFLICHR
jgi:hypothetical protein